MTNNISGLRKVNCKQGAPLGRAGDAINPDFAGVIVCEPILDPCPNACGAYDYRGAYWGAGHMVWRLLCTEGEDEYEAYVRTRNIEAHCKVEIPHAKSITVLTEPIGEHCSEDTPCDYCLELELEESCDD